MREDGTGKGAHYFPKGHPKAGSFHDPDDPDAGGDTAFDKPKAERKFRPPRARHKRVAKDAVDLPDVRQLLGETHFEKKRDPKGIDPLVRKVWFPELFKEKFSVELIRNQYINAKPPLEVEQLMHELIPYKWDRMQLPGRTWDGSTPPKYVLCLHPAFPGYWALFEYVSGGHHGAGAGPGYKCFSVAMDEPKDGELPPGMNEKRWRHLIGKIGVRRQFTRKDFESLRYYADKHLGADEIDKRLDEYDVERTRATDAFHSDLMDDFHDYYFRAVQQAANEGQKQWCHVTNHEEITKANNESKLYQEKRQGFTIRTKKDSPIARQLQKEMEELTAGPSERDRERDNAELLHKRAAAINLGQLQQMTRPRKKTL